MVRSSLKHVLEGITYRDEADEQTGHGKKWLSKQKIKPRFLLLIVEGKEKKAYNLPVGSHIVVDEGRRRKSGQVLVKIPRVLGKLRDITGGLPRVTELFEARNPSNPAVVCEIDGVVTFGRNQTW